MHNPIRKYGDNKLAIKFKRIEYKFPSYIYNIIEDLICLIF